MDYNTFQKEHATRVMCKRKQAVADLLFISQPEKRIRELDKRASLGHDYTGVLHYTISSIGGVKLITRSHSEITKWQPRKYLENKPHLRYTTGKEEYSSISSIIEGMKRLYHALDEYKLMEWTYFEPTSYFTRGTEPITVRLNTVFRDPRFLQSQYRRGNFRNFVTNDWWFAKVTSLLDGEESFDKILGLRIRPVFTLENFKTPGENDCHFRGPMYLGCYYGGPSIIEILKLLMHDILLARCLTDNKGEKEDYFADLLRDMWQPKLHNLAFGTTFGGQLYSYYNSFDQANESFGKVIARNFYGDIERPTIADLGLIRIPAPPPTQRRFWDRTRTAFGVLTKYQMTQVGTRPGEAVDIAQKILDIYMDFPENKIFYKVE